MASPPSPRGHPDKPIEVLILEEDDRDAGIILRTLDEAHGRFSMRRAASWEEFTRDLRESVPDIVLSAYSLTGSTGLDVLYRLRDSGLKIPFILVTGTQPESVAVECMKAGADDYLLKSSLRRLVGAVENAVERHEERLAREKAEADLRHQRDLYETLLTAQSDAGLGCAIVSDQSHRIIHANSALCAVLGYSEDEFRALPTILKLIDDAVVHRVEAFILRRKREGPHPDTMEISLKRKSGELVETAVTIKLPRGDHDTRLIVLVRDISDLARKARTLEEALESLRASEEQFRLLLEGVQDYAIFMIDLRGKIKSWNAGAERILGYSSTEILGKHHSSFYPKDEVERTVPETGITLATTEGRSEFEAWCLRKDETRFRAHIIVTTLREKNGRPVGYSTVIRDVTEAKEAEDRLRRQGEELGALARHLQSAREEERSRIARELHDELSQVLTAFRMDISILERKIVKVVGSAERGALLEELASMSSLAQKTIKAVTRIVSELRPAALDEFGLTTAIQWHVQEFEKRTGIRCMFTRLQRDLEVIPEKATALFRILQEALTNVARHSGATNVELSFVLQGDELVLTIRDNGRGIDGTRTGGGQSFGLLGMGERARLLGGTLEIHAAAGEGTTITVRIPAGEAVAGAT